MEPARLDRIKGSLVGFHLGDALGAPYEFERRPGFTVPARFYVGAFGTRPGQGTDDSAMARAAAEAFLSVEDGSVTDPCAAYMDNLVDWYDSSPADIGNQTLLAVLAHKENRPVGEGAKGGEGNGGLFAAHVCAAFGQSGLASSIASCTHSAERVGRVAHVLANHVRHAMRFGTRFSRGYGDTDVTVPLVRPWDTNIGHAPVTYSIAYRAAEMTGGDPESALPVLLHTIALGGDTDSNAAVTGGVLGAMYGMAAWEKFPELDKLEDLEYWSLTAEQAAERNER